MTEYELHWLDAAVGELVQWWIDALGIEQRNAIRRAADEADRVLAAHPKRDADHLSEGLWRLEIAPLRFYFSVDDEKRVVEVTNVRLMQ